MKIHVLSDLHLYGDIRKPLAGADVTVLAGDIWDGGIKGIDWAAKTWTDRLVIYVPGNHEFFGAEYNEHREAMAAAAARHPTLYLLDRGRLRSMGSLSSAPRCGRIFGTRHPTVMRSSGGSRSRQLPSTGPITTKSRLTIGAPK